MKTSAPGHLHGLKLFNKVLAFCGVLQSLKIAQILTSDICFQI